MILITRLNQQCFHVNPDLIKTIEQLPHTVLTLINGEKLVARESAEEIIARITEFRRGLLEGLQPRRDAAGSLPSPGGGATG